MLYYESEDHISQPMSQGAFMDDILQYFMTSIIYLIVLIVCTVVLKLSPVTELLWLRLVNVELGLSRSFPPLWFTEMVRSGTQI